MDMKLSAKALQLRREYNNKWRRENPEKVKLYAKRHWEKKAAQAA